VQFGAVFLATALCFLAGRRKSRSEPGFIFVWFSLLWIC